MLLFLGKSKFNMFQIGFMFFFVAYGSSDYLFRKTSVLLPMFISFFIIIRYIWSLVWVNFPNYEQQSDFFNMVDGWVPPADYETNRYWARKPNMVYWGLLFMMTLLHTINRFFPDSNQNKKYLDECYERIRIRFPLISKWINRIVNIIKTFALILMVSGMGIGLVR